jgi:hypothetical protein
MDFQDIWDRAKHGEPVSEQEIDAAVSALASADCGDDRDLIILILGLTRKPTPSLVALVETFLVDGRTDAERYSALKTLCRHWGLWDQYLEYLLTKITPEEFDRDPAVSDEAFNLLAEYLRQHTNRNAWRRLVSIYDNATAAGKHDLAMHAYSSMHEGLFGAQEALRRMAGTEYRNNDEVVLAAARSKAGLTH